MILFLLISLFTLLTPRSALAGTDLTVNCQTIGGGGDCTITPAATPLFDEINWLPGDSVDQVLTVANQSLTDDCSLHLSVDITTDSILKNVLENSITRNTNTVYQDTMTNLLNAPEPIFLETVPANQTYIYDWHVDMDVLADNAYQDLSVVFDLNLHFSCGDVPTPTNTPAPPAPDGGDGDGSPTCDFPTPSAPTNLQASPDGPGEVNLAWTPPTETVTHYAILYGTSPGTYIYGNYNIGDVTSYTVQGLVPGQIYYFVVMAINDCAPGPYSNETSSVAGGGTLPPEFIPGQPAPGFENVQGATTEEGEIAGGDELGTSTQGCCPKLSPWWWILLLIEALYFVYLHQENKEKGDPALPTHITFPLILIIVHLLLTKLLDPRFEFLPTPRWTALFPLLSILLSVIFYPFENKEK